eukprot:3710426-Amphidinium_carterae.1
MSHPDWLLSAQLASSVQQRGCFYVPSISRILCKSACIAVRSDHGGNTPKAGKKKKPLMRKFGSMANAEAA